MANKVLDLLWNLAHSDDAPTEIIDQAVAAHIKILDYSCSSDKESQKLKCLEKCIEQLKENKWVIVSMRQIKEILQQYPEVFNHFSLEIIDSIVFNLRLLILDDCRKLPNESFNQLFTAKGKKLIKNCLKNYVQSFKWKN